MNSRVSLPPISDILSNSATKPVSLEDAVRAYNPAQPTYPYPQAPMIIQQMPIQQTGNMPIQSGSIMAAPTMIAASPMNMGHPLNPVYPMVPMPSYRLINPNYHVGEAPHLPNSSFTYRYPMAVPPPSQQPQLLQTQPQHHSAPAVVGGGLRALIVSELSTKASTPASPTSLDRVNRMTPERVSEMVRRPTPSPPVRSRTRNNLPKETTYILLKWLEEHLNHPYPNSFEKTQLMFSTGLNQQQLSNWFINARRRKIRAMKQRQKV